jgi:acetyl-CoA carboxylase biotin carboxylase subunit
VHIGAAPARESYLSIPAVIDAARQMDADAIHPGYGFLSENPEFGHAVEEAGLIFIGPRPETMARFGDKLAARKAAKDAGLLVLPGPDQPISDDINEWELGTSISFPLMVKAAAGGGGKGIRLARNKDELLDVIQLAREEAVSAFGDGSIYLEPLVQKARHIEVQILGDGQGNVISFGERECSIQRRHQKLIEEAPAPNLSPSERNCLIGSAIALGETENYRGLGTVEFLMDENHQFYFIEVNPRIQVEHPVTEMVTGVDLVREQLILATSGKLGLEQSDIRTAGAAIEARVLAEDPTEDFLPTTGEITYLKEPGGIGLRVDSSLFHGMQITADYDSLLAKVIAWDSDRKSAINRLRRGLREFQIGGPRTSLNFISKVLDSHPYREGEITTTFLDEFNPVADIPNEGLAREAAIAAALHKHKVIKLTPEGTRDEKNLWRETAQREQITPRIL